MLNNVSEKQIAIFEFAFKKNTGNTRETPAITVCKILLDEEAKLNIYDPKVPESQIYSDLTSPLVTDYPDSIPKSVQVFNDPYDAVRGCHAVVICTECDELVTLDYKKMYDSMEKPAYLFDGLKMVDHNKLIGMGYHVMTIGKKLQKSRINKTYGQIPQ